VQRQPSIDRLSSGSVDPFSRYPIELDHESQSLLANSKYKFCTDLVCPN
jgi:hypothetical protein